MGAFKPIWTPVDSGESIIEAFGGLDLDYINERYRIYDPALGRLVEKPWTDIVNNRSLPAGRTYWDADGVLQTAAADAPVIEYDPVTGVKLGNRIWGTYQNIIRYAQAFNNSYWLSLNTSVTANSKTGINSTNAFKLTPFTNFNNHLTFDDVSDFSYTAGQTYIIRWVVAAAGYNWAQIAIPSSVFGTNVWANFNIATGSVGSVGSQTIEPSIRALPGGYFEISMKATATATVTANRTGIQPLPSNINARLPSYTGDASSGIHANFAEMSLVSTNGPFAVTTGAAVTIPSESQIIDGQNFIDLFNKAEGTVYLQYRPALDSATVRAVVGSNEPSGNLIFHGAFSEGYGVDVRSFGGGLSYSSPRVVRPQTQVKIAVSFKADGTYRMYINGALALAWSGFDFTAMTQLNIAFRAVVATVENGHYARILYLQKALPNSLAQRISQL